MNLWDKWDYQINLLEQLAIKQEEERIDEKDDLDNLIAQKRKHENKIYNINQKIKKSDYEDRLKLKRERKYYAECLKEIRLSIKELTK